MFNDLTLPRYDDGDETSFYDDLKAQMTEQAQVCIITSFPYEENKTKRHIPDSLEIFFFSIPNLFPLPHPPPKKKHDQEN